MEKPSNEPPSNKKRNILLTTLAIFVIVVVGLAGTDYGENLRSRILEKADVGALLDHSKTSVCWTKECVDLGQRMRYMMNPEVNPCDDFFESVCGNYNGDDSYEVWNHLAEDRTTIQEFLKKYKTETKSEEIALIFIRKCMQTRSDPDIDQGIWKSNDLTELLLEMSKVEPINTGFIKNSIQFDRLGDEIFLILNLKNGIEKDSKLKKLSDKYMTFINKTDIVDIRNVSKDIKFMNLNKYATGLLPENNRNEVQNWEIGVDRNELLVLDKLVKRVGVKKIKKILYEKWKNKLASYLVDSKTPYVDCFLKAEKLFPGTIGMIFVKNFVKSRNIERTNELFEELKVVFNEMLDENTWIDEDLKNNLREELKNLKSSLGVPDEHKDLNNIDRMYARVEKEQKVEDQSYLTLVRNLLKMNSEETFLRVARGESVSYRGQTIGFEAHFAPLSHRITISPTLLNFPYIDKNLPEWNTISSLGYILAHEIGHAFDATGFFTNSSVYQISMDEDIKNEFDQRIDCITKKYDKFQFPDGSFSSGNFTKQEDSADMIGFNLAYRLFKKLDKKQQKLPRLEQYTVEQNYFQRMAYVWCARTLDEFDILRAKTDVHSAMKFRINGMMSNSKEFARAFKCEKNSPMNPEKKCPLFK